MSQKYPAPSGLSKRANKRWNEVVTRWDLRPDELRVLEDACREMDLVDALEELVGSEGLTATGSMGQVVIHPAVQEVRQHRSILASLLRSLKLPDEVAESAKETAGDRSSAARAAAKSRWTVHHGAA